MLTGELTRDLTTELTTEHQPKQPIKLSTTNSEISYLSLISTVLSTGELRQDRTNTGNNI